MKVAHIAYPKIPIFSGFLKEIKHDIDLRGIDEDGNPIYTEIKKYPKIKVSGTVKLHGDNAAVCVNKDGDVWCQSRRNVITPLKDNKGFATWVEDKKDIFLKIAENFHIKPSKEDWTTCIYGEWAGGDNQNGSSMQELAKEFYIFGVKHVNRESHGQFMAKSEVWASPRSVHDTVTRLNESKVGVHSIRKFINFEVEIDLNRPEQAQTQFEWVTKAVENSCPASKLFGKEGVGEGVVWYCTYNHFGNSKEGETSRHFLWSKKYFFKTKGQKHSVSRVKKVASVDIETVNSINEFADMVVTENRVRQAMDEVKKEIYAAPNGELAGEPILTKADTPKILKWMAHDIMSEDIESLLLSKLEWKQVAGVVSAQVRKYYFQFLEEDLEEEHKI